MSAPLKRWGDRIEPPLVIAFQCFLFWLVMFLLSGSAVPGINESHYLPKAKHLWNEGFAPGDLFLESHDSHFLTSAMAGLAARALPLTAVAWLGRVLSWGLLAGGWWLLCRSLQIPILLRPFALASWLLGVHHGHWAGEWVVGGFEAKTIAYPFILCGLSQVAVANWKWVWPWMGAAMAWHPVVGGWAGLSAGITWLLQPELKGQIRGQIPWLIAGAGLALIGIVPAAAGLGGPDVVDNVSAAQVHVFLRLPHHLSPQLFASQRHWAAAISLSLFAVITVLWLSRSRTLAHTLKRDTQPQTGLGRLLICGWCAVGFALVGLSIDMLLSAPRPDIAASLLRFYWFRWSDVVVPLIGSLVLWKWLSAALASPSSATAVRTASATPSWLAQGLLGTAILASLFGIVAGLQLNAERLIPAADRLVVESVGKHNIQTDRYVDWLAVCRWIRENTPSDSLWLTPKYQQSFKWHAERAEVVCWKDVPQDNAAVIEWYHRIERCAPPRDSSGRIREWTTQELLDLSSQYGFRWILIDRTYQSQPPALEIKYPLVEHAEFVDNRSFAILYIPDALAAPE
jgi:hypothetical protein